MKTQYPCKYCGTIMAFPEMRTANGSTPERLFVRVKFTCSHCYAVFRFTTNMKDTETWSSPAVIPTAEHVAT